MNKALIVDNCNACPYHEEMYTGEYARRTDRVYFCAYSPVQFLIPNKDKYEIHPDCELDDLDVILRAYA